MSPQQNNVVLDGTSRLSSDLLINTFGDQKKISEEAMHTSTLTDQPDKTPRKISMHLKNAFRHIFRRGSWVWKLVPLRFADDGELFILQT